jgi:hypothetical protein
MPPERERTERLTIYLQPDDLAVINDFDFRPEFRAWRLRFGSY